MGYPVLVGWAVRLVSTMSENSRAFGLTSEVARGVSRMLMDAGWSPLLEFTLPNGRRLDVAAISDSGEIIAVEIKVSLEDFRGDGKWVEYLDYCDRYFFAVPDGFPILVLPEEHGLIVADKFGAAIIREASGVPLSPARRKAMLIRFARTAAERYARMIDPNRV